MWTTLWIGGKITAANVARLQEAVNELQIEDYSGLDGPENELAPVDGQVIRISGDMRFGNLPHGIEERLKELSLTYRVQSEPDGEFGGQIIQWNPGMATPEAIDADEDEPIMTLSTMRRLVGEGRDAKSLLGHLEPFARPIPPIEIIPNPAPGPMETAGAH